MESEDEVDVEGDFDLCARNDVENILNDFNEPPSEMALLHPELSQHPWALEQGWSLDQCTDDKSRAVIEKMLLEEQSYTEGTEVIGENPESSFNFASESKKWTSKPSRRLWTEEEKAMFEKGIEIFGKKWSKIAELIPSRTSEQVKHYGYSYFRKIENPVEKVEFASSKGHYAHSLKEMLTAVTTGQPTIATLPKKKCKEKFNIIEKDKVQSKPETPQAAVEQFPEAEVVRLQKQSDDESVEVNVEDEEDFCSSNVTEEVKLELKTENPVKLETKQKTIEARGSDSLFVDTLKAGTEILYRENSTVNSDLGMDQLEFKPFTSTNADLSAVDGTYIKNHTGVVEKWPKTDDILTDDGELELDLLDEVQTGCILVESCLSDDRSNSYMKTVKIKPGRPHSERSEIGGSVSYDHRDIQTLFGTIRDVESHKNLKQEENESRLKANEGNSNIEQVRGVTEAKDEISEMYEGIKRESSVDNDSHSDGLEQPEKKTEGEDESPTEEEEFSQEFGIQGSDSKVYYLPNPVEEKIIDHEHISEEEKEIFAEFFDGRPGLKDAERYCKIRNYILDMWKESKPSFLYKTNIRGGLKKCGDVNVIGRIHAYLEQIGAINFGCDQVQYRVRKKRRKKKPSVNSTGVQLAKYRKESLQQRRRKVRDMFGSWVDEKEHEGTTIDHTKPPENHVKPQNSRKRKFKHQYDPFKLIPCQDFSTSVAAPFKVHLDLTSLIVMDVHAHLSKTEVIGLLGGLYDNKKKVLEILRTEPCDSLSTGLQCEMDPVSQTEAKERIASMNMQVVGWYHSHPTFEPNPSVRDIETQECLQEWFAVGRSPFIGVIINPYSGLHNNMQSTVKSIIISRHTNKCANMGLPFQFDHQVIMKLSLLALLETIKHILSKYSVYQNRVDMLSSFKPGSTVTCVDKLIVSINNHFKDIHSTDDKDAHARKMELENFILNLRNMVEQCFNSQV